MIFELIYYHDFMNSCTQNNYHSYELLFILRRRLLLNKKFWNVCINRVYQLIDVWKNLISLFLSNIIICIILDICSLTLRLLNKILSAT